MRLQTTNVKVSIIKVYTPTTADRGEVQLQLFCDEVEQVLNMTHPREVTIVIDDFSAKVSNGYEVDFVGNFGLGTRNKRVETLVQFCEEKGFIVANTFYKLPE